VTRHGVRYVGVSLQARIDSAWTGYAVGRRAEARFSRIVEDIVWLQQVRSGTWRLAKPSLSAGVTAKPLRWSVRASIPRQVASDVVPGRNPEHVVDLGVDQATGRVVRSL
jgi:hypothetical protein